MTNNYSAIEDQNIGLFAINGETIVLKNENENIPKIKEHEKTTRAKLNPTLYRSFGHIYVKSDLGKTLKIKTPA